MTELFTLSNLLFAGIASLILTFILLMFFNKQKDLPENEKASLFSLRTLFTFVIAFVVVLIGGFVSDTFSAFTSAIIFTVSALIIVFVVFFKKLFVKN